MGAYLPPPTLSAAGRAADGAVRLSGHAPADALVRLRAPDGGGATAQAAGDGQWTLTVPPADIPRLYALQAELPARVVRGEGAIAIMPAPGPPAVTLRAGFAGIPAGRGQPDRLQLATFDYDGGGGGAVGGFAPPASRVRLTVDGGLVGVTNADAQGRFAVLAVRSVAPGPHRIRVETRDGLGLEQPVELVPAALPPGQPFAAARAPGGWRISWQLPGGGVQSSLVFDSAAISARASGPGKSAAR